MQKYQYEFLYKYALDKHPVIHQVTHVEQGIICTIFTDKLENIKYTLLENGNVIEENI